MSQAVDEALTYTNEGERRGMHSLKRYVAEHITDKGSMSDCEEYFNKQERFCLFKVQKHSNVNYPI